MIPITGKGFINQGSGLLKRISTQTRVQQYSWASKFRELKKVIWVSAGFCRQ